MSTTLTTRPGQGLNATVYASRDLTGYTTVVELSSSGKFSSVTTKTPTVAGRQASFTLSSTEVDTLKDCHYRVKATKGGATVIVDQGNIDYIQADASVSSTIDIKRDFNAKGDGVTDDRAAIQAAINAARAGDTILFPDNGIYMCGFDSNGYGLILKAGIRLRGPGATLKITSGTQDWQALLYTTAGSGLVIEDLTIDCNYTGRPVTDATKIATAWRMVLRVLGGDDVTVRRVTVTGHSGLNTLDFNGAGMHRITVEDCKFLDMGNCPVGQGADHSTIYVNAIGMRITGNEFVGASPALAHAAIETHGASQVVTGNVVHGYGIMGNITGVTAGDSDNIVVTDNVGRQVMCGFELWAMSNSGGTSPVIRNLIISNNVVTMDRDYHLPYGGVSFRFPQGIFLSSASDRSLSSVDISHNQLYFAPYSAAALDDENHASGIVFYRSGATPDRPDERITIEGNTIVNAPGPAIRYADAANRLRILNNTIIDPGGTNSGLTASVYRTGIILGANAYSDVDITGNLIVDTRATHLVTSAIYLAVVTSVTNGRVIDNTFRCTDGTSLAGITPASGTGKAFYVEHEMDTWIGLFQPVQPGSKVRVRSTGAVYVNVNATDGGAPSMVQTIAGKFTAQTAQAVTATTPGTVTKKLAVYAENGSTVLGYIALYGSIT